MGDAKVSTDFFGILKDKEPTLAGIFEGVIKKGLEEWVDMLKPEKGSHTGYPHLRNVERIANRIIPDGLKNSFNAGEIFLLLNAIFLHDIGKSIESPIQPLPKCEHPETCQEHGREGQFLCFQLQASHYARGEALIKNKGIELGLPDERIARYCGLIVFCHGLGKPPLTTSPAINESGSECEGKRPIRGDYRTTSLAPYGIVRIPLLASILRIADETDSTWTRALDTYWIKDQESNSSDLGKAFRKCIEDIEFCFDGQCLVMHIPEMDEKEIDHSENLKKYIKSINQVRGDIDAVIHEWGGELEKIGVRFNEVYIEYKNHLYIKFDPTSASPSSSLLSDLLGPNSKKDNQEDRINKTKIKKSVEEMFNAMIELSLGSFGYPQFTWKTLEAQVGHPLTEVDQWLAKRIADASKNHIVINEKNEILVNVERENVNEIMKLIYPLN